MADRYWVGDGGDWNDTAHWSTESGGVGGSAVPTTNDDVYFDENSFTTTGQSIHCEGTGWGPECNNMDWTGALYNPNFNLDNGDTGKFDILGDLTLVSGMTWTHTETNNGELLFYKNNLSLDTKGVTINVGGFGLEFAHDEDSDTIDLLSSLVVNGTIRFTTYDHDLGGSHTYKGIFNTNNQDVTIIDGDFLCGGTMNFGNSIITLMGEDGWGQFYASQASIINVGTSLIYLSGSGASFTGANKTYYDMKIDSTETIIWNSNTFHNFTLDPGAVLYMSEVTQTITGKLYCVGTSSNRITIDSGGSNYEPYGAFSQSSGIIDGDYLNLSHNHAIGGALFYAGDHSWNGGDNDGWIWSSYATALAATYGPEGEQSGTGIYTLGRYSTSYPLVLDLTYPISERDGTDFVFDGVEVGSIIVDGNDVYVAWKHTSPNVDTYGIDKLDYDNKLNGAYFETRVLSGNREILGNFSKFIISYGEIPTGTDIVVQYSKDYGTTWVTMTTKKDTDRKLLYCEEEFEASSVAYRVVITATGNDAPAIERADIVLR